MKTPIIGLSLTQLELKLAELGLPKFRAAQVFAWLYQHKAKSFATMTNIGKSLREELDNIFAIDYLKTSSISIATDGVVKFLFNVGNCNNIETVFIPEKNRGTLCISSQVGCALNCKFCATGFEGFNKNLSSGEIIGQLLAVEDYLQNNPNPVYNKITNVVMMGMGEPLLNYDNVLSALQIMVNDFAFGLSKRRVTLSTSGVVPGIDALYQDIDCALAVSLHAPNDALRTKIMPINKKYNLATLKQAMQRYVKDGNRKKHITIEYVMLKDINDSQDHAKQLAKYLSDVPVKINLIPFNSFSKSDYVCSSTDRINSFKNYLVTKGYLTTIRKTRGEKIAAACGQLAGDFKDKTKRKQYNLKQLELARAG